MAFNPGVSDQRAEITQRGMSQIADYTYQGLVAQGRGIAGGISQVTEGLAEAGKQWEETRALQEANAGEINGLANLAQANPELLGGLDLAKIMSETSPQKQAAHLAVAKGMLQANLSLERQKNYLNAQTNAAANLASYKQAVAPQVRMPSEDDVKQMDAAGKIWDPSALKFVNKNNGNPLAALFGNGPAVTPGPPPGAGAGGQAPAPVGQPAAPQVISAAEASRRLGRTVRPGERLTDASGNVIMVQ